VEDDDRVAAAQEVVLRRHGIHTTRVATGAQALDALRPAPGRFDVVVLDLGLPDVDGLTLCRDIRRLTDTPIIISSARGDITTRLHGLHTGADDYLIKPYDLRELVARIHAHLRRRTPNATTTRATTPGATTTPATPPSEPSTSSTSTGSPDGVVRAGPVQVDHARRVVRIAGAPVELTTKEFDLVALLASAPGVVFTRDQIIAAIWGTRDAGVDHNLDVHIARIRRRTGDPALIGTVRGVGYHLGPRTRPTDPAPHPPPPLPRRG